MTTLALVGAGHIGSQIARLGVANGYDVVVSNSRGRRRSSDLVAELGPSARAATVEEAARAGDIVVVTIPLKSIESAPRRRLRRQGRDRHEQLLPAARRRTSRSSTTSRPPSPSCCSGTSRMRTSSRRSTTSTRRRIATDGLPSGDPSVARWPSPATTHEAKAAVTALLDEFGFDAVDLGPLSEGWRVQRDTPGYGPRLTAAELRQAPRTPNATGTCRCGSRMSAASFLVVPQWQGSGSSRAMRLIDGAEAIQGDLPVAATTVVTVPAAAGESLGTGVHRFSALDRRSAKPQSAELMLLESPVVTIGGDCAADLASVQHAVAAREPGSVALVWFDAHGDLNDVGLLAVERIPRHGRARPAR